MTHTIAMSLPYGIEPVYVVEAVGLLALALAGWPTWHNRNRSGGLPPKDFEIARTEPHRSPGAALRFWSR